MRSIRVGLLRALLILVGMSAATAQAQSPVSSDRQILVMIRVAADHYRPSGGYASSYDDQLGESARRHVARTIASKHRLTLIDNWPMPMIGVDCFVMSIPDGRSTNEAAAEVARDTNVAWAQPVAFFAAQSSGAFHDDPLYAAQPSAAIWHLRDLHQMASGRGTRVAIVDSGVDAAHPDLAGQLLVNRNFVAGVPFVPEEHGTAIAGIIGAKADNRIGIAGVAPGARLMGLRACWQRRGSGSTLCDSLSIAKALYFAVETRAEVINMSLSGPNDLLLRQLINLALDRKLVVVAAYDPKTTGGGFPASVTGVVAVADTAVAGLPPNVYTAPGRDVPTTEPGGRWFLVNGSSFAAAHVSGLLALLRERQRSAPLTLVSERHGGGAIDACATLFRIARTCDCACRTNGFAGAGDHR